MAGDSSFRDCGVSPRTFWKTQLARTEDGSASDRREPTRTWSQASFTSQELCCYRRRRGARDRQNGCLLGRVAAGQAGGFHARCCNVNFNGSNHAYLCRAILLSGRGRLSTTASLFSSTLHTMAPSLGNRTGEMILTVSIIPLRLFIASVKDTYEQSRETVRTSERPTERRRF